MTTLATGILLTLPAPALTADTAGNAIPVVDPELLGRLGFEPDAGNVYATPQAYERLQMSPAERTAAQERTVRSRREAMRAARDGGVVESSFGTDTAGYSAIHTFHPSQFDDGHTGGNGTFCIAGRSSEYSVITEFQHLPHGAKLEHVDLWYRDENTESVLVAVMRLCYPDDDGNWTTAILGHHETTGAADFVRFASIGPLNEDIDLQSCGYFVVVVWPDPCPDDGALGVQRLRAQWRRQVSPPPAGATFDDVPTSHLFFQHIEALAASGITGGCGGGDFCPDAPLTRGQMAVFLAKALGLHWGEISQ